MRIEGTPLEADGFAGAGPVLLSHYHRDHMNGLERLQPGRPVFCSAITAALLAELDGVPRDQLRPVAIGEAFEPAPGVRAMALDGNHCPGALMFAIEAGGRRILHTGDFRLNDTIRAECAALAPVDLLYLDTTYDAPQYRFPSQDESIAQVLELIRAGGDGLEVFLAVYTIGKDRLLQAVHETFGEPIYVTEQKYAACRVMGLGGIVTRTRGATRFRAYARGYFESYFKLKRAHREGPNLVIIPTGWAVDESARDPDYHYVPYSEHCDHAELEEFRALVRARRTVALV